MLLAIDPGEDTGWALFGDDATLIACGLGDPPETPAPSLVLVETPKARPRDPNPQSLIVLARRAGFWLGVFRAADASSLTPNDWKGSTPKDVSHRRIFAALAPSEIQALVRGCVGVSPRLRPINESIADGLSKTDKRHNILDAIGIGLHGVGRNANGR